MSFLLIVLGVIFIIYILLFYLFVYSLVSVSKYDDEEIMNKIKERNGQNEETVI